MITNIILTIIIALLIKCKLEGLKFKELSRQAKERNMIESIRMRGVIQWIKKK